MPRTAHAYVLSTIADLIEGGYQYHMTCPECGLTRPVDLQALAKKYGPDATFIRPQSPIRAKCKRCGGIASDGVIIPPHTSPLR